MDDFQDCCSAGFESEETDPHWEEKYALKDQIENTAWELQSLSEKIGRPTSWEQEILRISSSLNPAIKEMIERTYHDVLLTKLLNDMDTLRSLHKKIQEETNKLYDETRSPFDCCRD